MLIQKKLIGILILTSVSFFLWGKNCASPYFIDSTLSKNNIEEIKILSAKIENCENLKDSLAMCFHKLSVLFYRKDNLDSAIFYTQKALNIRRALFQNNPNIDYGKSLNNLGAFYSIQNKNRAAKIHLEEAIKVFSNLDTSRMVNSYFELGRVLVQDGEYEMGKDILDFVVIEGEKLGEKETAARAWLNLGLLYHAKKDYSKAIEHLKKAEPILHADGTYEDEAACYNNLGINYFRLNDFPNAIAYYLKANEIFKKINNCTEVAKCHNNLGLVFQKNNDITNAIENLKQGLNAAKKCKSTEMIVQSYDHFGEFYLAKKDAKKALSYFQKSIETLLPDFNSKSKNENPNLKDIQFAFNKIDLLIYLSDKAKALRSLSESENDTKYLTSALQIFELGDYLIDQLRKEHQDQDTKLFWRKQAIPFYENAIEICYELQEAEKAFFFFEKSKAILLLEALQVSNALELVPDSLKNGIQAMQQKLLQTKESLESSTTDKRETIIKKLIKLQSDFENKSKSIAQNYPKFFDVKFETQVIDLADFKTDFLKNENQVAIHFFYGVKNVYAITINLQNVKLIRLGTTANLEPSIRTLLSFFEKSSNIENRPKDFLAVAQKNYENLIADLQISQHTDWLIFPDGALAYLPFEALVKKRSDNMASADYVLRDHVIRYGYSATILSKQKRNQVSQQNNGIAAFAPFAENVKDSQHPTLAFSQDELHQISQQFSGDFLKNNQAQKQDFLNRLQQFSVLHLSTHAYSSATESKPHIVFADTSLFLSELYGLSISTNLVVLSACQSNIGKLSPGEGVMSLGRGFTYAGAQSLVSSLWNVNAASTGNILSGFYKNLQNKSSKNTALHAAKLAYLNNEDIPSFERSPYYWAGMIYYGDDGGVILKEKTSVSFFVKVLLFFLVGLGTFYFFKTQHSTK